MRESSKTALVFHSLNFKTTTDLMKQNFSNQWSTKDTALSCFRKCFKNPKDSFSSMTAEIISYFIWEYPPIRPQHEVGVKNCWAPVRDIVKQAGDKIKQQKNTLLINIYILTANIEKNCMASLKRIDI